MESRNYASRKHFIVYTHSKVYHFSLCKVYISVTLSTFSLLCGHPHQEENSSSSSTETLSLKLKCPIFHTPPPPSPWQPPFSFHLHEFDYFGYLTYVESHII